MSDSDAHKLVWDKFTTGDEFSLLELYNQHYLGLMNYGRIFVEDQEFVRECFMDMLIDFWKKRDALPKVENVRSYLMTSFRRHLFHQVNADKKRNSKETASQHFTEQYQASYEEYLVKIQSDKDVKLKIERALQRLTVRQRELIRLKFFDNMDYDDIAVSCSITRRTAYNIIYDALKILKEELNGDQPGNAPLHLFLALLVVPLL